MLNLAVILAAYRLNFELKLFLLLNVFNCILSAHRKSLECSSFYFFPSTISTFLQKDGRHCTKPTEFLHKIKSVVAIF